MRTFLVPVAFLLAGCRPVLAPTEAASPLVAESGAPEGERPLSEVVASCVSSGVERCFNAIDDNCNGLVDEGCGFRGSALFLAAAWDTNDDVDLSLTLPDGSIVGKGGARGSTFTWIRDCPGTDCFDQNEEVISGTTLAPGSYRVTVRLARPTSVSGEVVVHLGGRVRNQSYSAVARLSAASSFATFRFTVGRPAAP